jgi:hypothetical protein
VVRKTQLEIPAQPVVIEVQLGKYVTPSVGVYLEFLTASGSESIYDDGFGVGVGVGKMY